MLCVGGISMLLCLNGRKLDMFVGVIFENPHETSLILLGAPRGLKGLLYTLNAIVSPTKVASLVYISISSG